MQIFTLCIALLYSYREKHYLTLFQLNAPLLYLASAVSHCLLQHFGTCGWWLEMTVTRAGEPEQQQRSRGLWNYSNELKVVIKLHRVEGNCRVGVVVFFGFISTSDIFHITHHIPPPIV